MNFDIHSADVRSVIAGASFPALPSPRAAVLLALQEQFAQSQWWSPEQLLEHQLQQAQLLLRHARETVPFYQRSLQNVGFNIHEPLTIETWRRLPILTRRDIQNAGTVNADSHNADSPRSSQASSSRLHSTRIPPQHGKIFKTQTSGSTGEPVQILGTDLTQLFWNAFALRDYHWHAHEHGGDFSGSFASIRIFPDNIGTPPHGSHAKDWGGAVALVHQTGSAFALSLTTDMPTQARWLQQHNPHVLLTYPTNLNALLEHSATHGWRLSNLQTVRTVGEMLMSARSENSLRMRCREVWGVNIVDTYSSQEFGYLALQCPHSENYHAMAEGALVEILKEDGMPALPGEVGRLVITSLHNFAMPLIRYELRDYAEAGICTCGRGLTTIKRIVGRSRNMLTLPDGRRHWPLVGFAEFRAVAPIRQYQMVQHTPQDIEVRFVVERALTHDEEARLTQVIQTALGYPFSLKFVYYDNEIPRTAGGKFEEFISRIENRDPSLHSG